MRSLSGGSARGGGGASLPTGRGDADQTLQPHHVQVFAQRLLRRQPDAATTVRVWPHARSPDARALAALQRLVAGAFGAAATLRLAPTVAYGAEDDPAGAQAADGGAHGAGGVNGASGVPGVP